MSKIANDLRELHKYADPKDRTKMLLNQAADEIDRLEAALWRIHQREWPAGDIKAGAHNASQMWDIADEAVQLIEAKEYDTMLATGVIPESLRHRFR